MLSARIFNFGNTLGPQPWFDRTLVSQFILLSDVFIFFFF
jgi:hypothetical protein